MLIPWSNTIKSGTDKYSYKKMSEPWRQQQGKIDTDTKADVKLYFYASMTEI